MSVLKEQLQNADKLLRQARIAEAVRLLPKKDFEGLSREERLLAANISRRTYHIGLGLRLLHPLIFSEHSRPQERELAEYAVLLTLNGGFEEAKRLLNPIQKPQHPETLLAKVWTHFGVWEFQESIPLLTEYIQQQKDPYYNFAGRINLTEALFETRDLTRCERELESIIKELSATSFGRLRANALHIQGMLLHAQGDLKKSQQVLQQGLSIFGKAKTSDKLLLHRQIGINTATELNDLKPLKDFRKVAAKDRAWDSLRKVDLESLKIKFDRSLFLKLYFGTPFVQFRRDLERLFPNAEVPDTFRWGDNKGSCLDLSSGKFLRGPDSVLSGVSLKLLEVFSKDLYSPLKIGDIFSGLFPDEHFHFVNSPNRVRQALHRFRQDIEEKKLPLSLTYREGFYLLKPLKNFAVMRDLQSLNRNVSTDSQFEILKALKYFSRKEAMSALGLPKATAIRLIGRYVAEGKLSQIGVGKSTMYKVVSY
ncbi:tetratricopeptide repeat protein [Bdellovibrio svalbardensis]|uniref:Uncharacterized protein n=1 Tax=Bdellovibrio svalbardensis TaxID=2972972 RepID=A0ABT6DLP7_9BACT|nr:hypothetical protein [Bdellovibrio svalbardensis]MDG0817807.1 hypothetical protein [Bdellovibrio svalbardensis]